MDATMSGMVFASLRRTTHHTSFRPKDDEMQLHEYGRFGRPT